MSPRITSLFLLTLAFTFFPLLDSQASAQGSSTKSTAAGKCILVEVYVTEGQPESDAALAAAKAIAEQRKGVRLVVRPTNDNEKNQKRLKAIADYFRFPDAETPVVYSMKHVIRGAKTQQAYSSRLERALTMEVFVRQGCSKCASAKAWLPSLAAKYPGMKIVYRDIVTDSSSRNELNRLASEYRRMATSTPVFHVCKSMVVGFDYRNTPPRLEGTLRSWMADCPQPTTTGSQQSSNVAPSNDTSANDLDQAQEVASLLPF